MTKTQKIYLTWNDDEADAPFWEQFDTLEDAVSCKGDGVEVYKAEPVFLGKYKRKVDLVKIKRRRKK